jgi:two-component system, OmpR family, sensor histidine kinase BaeS
VAERNVDRYGATGEIDLSYVAGLGPDAVPALAALPPSLRDCAMGRHAALLGEPDDLLGWNLARERARRTLRAIGEVRSCSTPSTAAGSRS